MPPPSTQHMYVSESLASNILIMSRSVAQSYLARARVRHHGMLRPGEHCACCAVSRCCSVTSAFSRAFFMLSSACVRFCVQAWLRGNQSLTPAAALADRLLSILAPDQLRLDDRNARFVLKPFL